MFTSATLRRALACAAVFLATPAVALALTRAPDPTRPVAIGVYSGRWYEIARTPNAMQKDCQAPTSDFDGWANGAFVLTETCHRGAASGPVKVVRARARILPGGDNTRFRASFFGGLVHQEYWVLDHADDNDWLIMATPGGNFVWVLARRPALPASTLAAAEARVAALGYAPSRLVHPVQTGG